MQPTLRLFLVFICQDGKPAVLGQRTYWIILIPSIKGLCYESKGFLFVIPGGIDCRVAMVTPFCFSLTFCTSALHLLRK